MTVCLGMRRRIGEPQLRDHLGRQVVGGTTGLQHHDVTRLAQQAVIARRQQRQYQVHHADIGTDAYHDQGFQPFVAHPLLQRIDLGMGINRADIAIDAVLAHQRGLRLLLQPGKFRHQLILAAALLTMGGIRRLRLARRMGINEGQQGAIALTEGSRQRIAEGDHPADLGIGSLRRQRTACDLTEAVDLIDDDQPGRRQRDRHHGRPHRQAGIKLAGGLPLGGSGRNALHHAGRRDIG